MTDKPKSILDNMEIISEGKFFQGCPRDERGHVLPIVRPLEALWNCSRCGAPVYGHKEIGFDQEPRVRFTCACRDTPMGLTFVK